MRRRNAFADVEALIDQARGEFEELAQQLETEGRGTALDVETREDEYVVSVDLPGYERSDVDVRLVDRRLVLDAEWSEESASDDDTESGRYLRKERRHQRVHEEVTFPTDVDREGASASMTNGVLTVTVPKATGESDGHHIDVE